MIDVISGFLRDVTVNLFEGETYNGSGILTTTYSSGTAKRLAIFPITFKDVQNASEGGYTMQDKKFYEIGSPSIPLKSIINFESEQYLTDQISDRNFEGNFSMYIGKKIDDSGIQD
jgi:hypothetical protein